jgi:hypothetical protein
MTDPTIWISLAAIGLSLFAIVRSWREHRDLDELERRHQKLLERMKGIGWPSSSE